MSPELSNAKGVVRLAIDLFRHGSRWYLKNLRERPVATASLSLVPPTFAASFVDIGMGFPVLLGETLGYLVGDQAVRGVKEGCSTLTKWWSKI